MPDPHAAPPVAEPFDVEKDTFALPLAARLSATERITVCDPELPSGELNVVGLIDQVPAGAAIVYGPTPGPPPEAPVGVTASIAESPIARARFTRPFPTPPSGSALRANRPTIVPGLAYGSSACNWAAAPAATAAAAEVPVIESVPPPTESALMPTPGAVMNTAFEEFEPLQSSSFWFVAPTPTTFSSPAG